MKPVAFAWVIAVTSDVFALPPFAQSVLASSKSIELRGTEVVVHYHPDSGLMDISWKDGHSITGLASGAVLEDGKTVSSTAYSSVQQRTAAMCWRLGRRLLQWREPAFM